MWILHRKCTSTARLTGKTAVVTGCNSGIGYFTALDLVKRGCRVIMACRDIAKAEDAATEIRKATEGVAGVGVVVVVRLDLCSFASVRECASQLLQNETHINLLINNAGVAFHPKGVTADGFEVHFGSNHLGHFLFTLLLLPVLISSAPARVVVVSSVAHLNAVIDFDDINMDRSYNPLSAYARSKLANIMFASELARRLEGTGVTTYSLHPGLVKTQAFRHLDKSCIPGGEWLTVTTLRCLGKNLEQGAQTSIYCAVDEKLATQSGSYYYECKKTKPSATARNPELALKLWNESLKMTGLENYDPFVIFPGTRM